MGLRIANRRFAPTLFAVVLTAIGVSVFVRLGMWQLDRAEQKRELIAEFKAGERTTVELTNGNATSQPRYQHVHARGHYEAARQILLDNMPSAATGRAGFRVITPFRIDGGGTVLVDRGWVPLGEHRTDLPTVEVAESSRSVAGRLAELPRPGISLGEPAIDATAPWPRVMNFPQHQTLERALGQTLLPGLILLDPDQPDGFERAWQQTHENLSPERHIGYAVQWFGFAAAAIIIFVILSLRKESSP